MIHVDQVRSAYRRHLQTVKNSSKAWNLTVEELVGPFNPETSEEQIATRQQVINILRIIEREINLEENDPYELAMDAALRDLRSSGVAEEAQRQYREHEADVKKTIDPAANRRKGPKEWSPRKNEKSEEDIEEELDQEMEGYDMYLYILFDDKGGLVNWTIDNPSYFRGHAGPTAQVMLSADLSYDDIRSAIDEAFQDIDWEKVANELGLGQ